MLDEDKKLAVILIVALLLRLLFLNMAVENQELREPDSTSYIAMAKAIAQGDFLFDDNAKNKEMARIRTPGYPLFLSVFYALGLDNNAVAFVQVLLDTASVFLIFLVFQYVFKSVDGGLAAAAIYAISPLSLSFSFKILTEVFAVFLFLAANYFFWRAFPGQDRKDILYSALIFGFMALVRPIALPIAVIYAVILYWGSRDLNKSMVLILIPAFFVFLWVFRNVIVMGKIQITSITAVTYTCWNAVFLANDAGVDTAVWGNLIKEYGLSSIEKCQTTNSLDKIEKGFPAILGFIVGNIHIYVKYLAKGALFFFSPVLPNYILGVLGQAGQQIHMTEIILKKGIDVGYIAGEIMKKPTYSFLFAFSAIYYAGMYLFAAFGVLKSNRYRKMFVVALVLLIMYNILLLGPVANYRYRMPLEPFIVMLAGFGMYHAFFKKTDVSKGKVLSPAHVKHLASSLRAAQNKKSVSQPSSDSSS